MNDLEPGRITRMTGLWYVIQSVHIECAYTCEKKWQFSI